MTKDLPLDIALFLEEM